MSPVLCKALARKAFGLRNLVFVVGENEVPAAAVDIYLVAECGAVHSRALYVPARPALTPGGIPAYFALLCRLPQCKVGGVPLLVGVFNAHAVEHILDRAVGKAAVGGEAGHVEIDVSACRGVCVAAFYQLCYEVDYVADVFGGFKPYVGVVYAELAHYLVGIFNHHLGVLVGGDARLVAARDDFVVDVGVVARILYVIALLLKVFAHYVVDERLKAVAYVRLARYRYAAGIHLYFARFDGLELLFLSGKRIVNSHNNSVIIPCAIKRHCDFLYAIS